MAKCPHFKIIFSLLQIIVIIPCLISAFLSAPEASHPLRTKFDARSLDFSVLAVGLQVQKAIPVSKSAITAGDFKFRVVEVVFDHTAMGFVPVDMDSNDQVMFVEVELLEGKKEDFKKFEITVSDGSGQKTNAFILISNGMMQMLATVTLKGISSDYQPGEDNIAWAYLVPKGSDKLILNFPTGEAIDLSPFLKSSRSVDNKPGPRLWLSE
jgi:hypothetical protein